MTSSNGALGATFTVTRALQVASMIAIIGMTSNFISQIVSTQATPPSILIGTLSIICIAVLYCVITFILYLDNLLPHLVSAAVDAGFLTALVVVSVVVGKPLSFLKCESIGQLNSEASSAFSFASSLGTSLRPGGIVNYREWIGSGKATCLQTKSIWGLCIALCVLFFLSSAVSVFLWKKSKTLAPAEKGEA